MPILLADSYRVRCKILEMLQLTSNVYLYYSVDTR
jgi:hypothetical protein